MTDQFHNTLRFDVEAGPELNTQVIDDHRKVLEDFATTLMAEQPYVVATVGSEEEDGFGAVGLALVLRPKMRLDTHHYLVRIWIVGNEVTATLPVRKELPDKDALAAYLRDISAEGGPLRRMLRDLKRENDGGIVGVLRTRHPTKGLTSVDVAVWLTADDRQTILEKLGQPIDLEVSVREDLQKFFPKMAKEYKFLEATGFLVEVSSVCSLDKAHTRLRISGTVETPD